MESAKRDNERDNVFTIELPGNDLIFTRYLYIKDEVIIALLVSILNKSDTAIFWAYELYYSGFRHELFGLIWKIYYEFFATLNPSYEAYLFKKHKQWLLNINNDDDNNICIVSSIVQDLLFRPFNTDIFNIRNVCESFEIDVDYHKDTEKITDTISLRQNMEQWTTDEDFRSISQWILNINKIITLNDIYSVFLDVFIELTNIQLVKTKLLKDFNIILHSVNVNINGKILLVSKIMTLFSRKYELKKGKSIYIRVEPEDIECYKTLEGYNVLKEACKYNIDNFKHLSLFKLTRNKYILLEKYWYNWEYHASFSPIWSQRIRQYKGYPDYTKQKVIFKEEPDDELMQEFYDNYGLEPDEQPKEVQEKSVQTIESIYNWKWFNEKYKNNGIFEIYEEELDEFDVCKIKYIVFEKV